MSDGEFMETEGGTEGARAPIALVVLHLSVIIKADGRISTTEKSRGNITALQKRLTVEWDYWIPDEATLPFWRSVLLGAWGQRDADTGAGVRRLRRRRYVFAVGDAQPLQSGSQRQDGRGIEVQLGFGLQCID